jgi:peptidoglycan hydrolase-like protein with peptidoglycan-binding domain
MLVTTDGSIGEISRESYVEAEERVVRELKELGKPFAMILNSARPSSDSAVALAYELEAKYGFLRPIEVTGGFDEVTEEAVKHFQEQNALSPSGILDRLTWNEIADQYNVLFSGFPIE